MIHHAEVGPRINFSRASQLMKSSTLHKHMTLQVWLPSAILRSKGELKCLANECLMDTYIEQFVLRHLFAFHISPENRLARIQSIRCPTHDIDLSSRFRPSLSGVSHALTGSLTINVNNDRATSAAASTVVSPGLSYIGATSTVAIVSDATDDVGRFLIIPMSAPTTSSPTSPSRIVKSSRVLQPPTSAVPVATQTKSLLY